MIFDNLGRQIPNGLIQFVDEVMKLRGSKDAPWSVIEKCFEYWEKHNPTKYRSFLVNVENLRNSRKNDFASTKDPVTGGILRYTLDIPEEVMFMIRKIYDTDELPMDKKFFNEFARRFPRFVVAKKL